MPNLKMMTTEAYQATDKIVHLSDSVFDFLGNAIHKSPRKRSRICTHRSVNEKLHEMFVIYNNDTYVRPNKHVGKDESVYVLKGRADFIFFDDAGKPTQVVRMGASGAGLAYYCRVPAEVYHTIIMRSEEIVLFEGTPGPFNPAETLYAEWAPAESERDAVAAYVQELNRFIAAAAPARQTLLPLRMLNTLVYAATERIVPLTPTENDFLKERLAQQKLDRIRICCHPGIEDRLHEMLMVFSRDTYIRPSLHVDKEESLLILEGFGTYVFLDERGNVVDRVPLGPMGSGRSFYCRIPANTYHCLTVESPILVAKETTSGPFSRADTEFPAWAPDGSDMKVAHRYLDTLGQALRLSA